MRFTAWLVLFATLLLWSGNRIVALLVVVCAFGLAYMAPWAAVEIYLERTFDLNAAGAMAVLYSAIGSLLLAYAGCCSRRSFSANIRAGTTLPASRLS